MTPQENAVLMFPAGYKCVLLFIAYVKHALVNIEMRAGERLQFLEFIDGCVGFAVTQEMVALIKPMSDTEVEMMHEARSLNREDDKPGSASFAMLTRPDVFGHFLALNPSLLAAIMLYQKKFDVPPVTFTQDAPRTIPNSASVPVPPAWLTGADRPERFLNGPAQSSRFAIGTPNHPNGGINVHTGRDQ